MEPGKHQHGNGWYDYLHVYSVGGTMRNDCDNQRGNYRPGHSNIHADCITLPKQYATFTAYDVNKWIDGHVEPGYHQYRGSGNIELYLYSSRWSMRKHRDNGHFL